MNACAIRWSRANAVLGVGAVAGYGLRNVYHSSAGQWPARPAECLRIVWNSLERAGTVFWVGEKSGVLVKRVTFLRKEWFWYGVGSERGQTGMRLELVGAGHGGQDGAQAQEES